MMNLGRKAEEALATRSSAPSTESSSSSRAALIAKRIRILFSSYRRDDFADPDGFVAQLGVILERYPDGVIIAVTDPLTGLQRRHKFPPSIAEIVEACEDEAESQRRKAEGPIVMRPPPEPLPRAQWPDGHLASVFVARHARRYAEMAERAGKAPRYEWRAEERGIWVPLTWFEEMA